MQDMEMPHLRDAREQVKQAFETPAPAAPATPETRPEREREYTFDFHFADGNGRAWDGKFTNRILTIGQKMEVGVIRGRRQAGVPLESMPLRTMELLHIVGWMEESLVVRPEWAKDLLTLDDEDLVEALWNVVARHERIFHGRGVAAPAGEGQPPAGPVQP